MASGEDPHRVDNDYKCQLDAATEEKAKRELNEDPKDRLNAVKALRTWLLQQSHITFYTDTRSLLAFLRTSKFSQLRAREMIENNATVMGLHSRWLRNIDPCEPGIMKIVESGYCMVLPKKDKNGCPILLYRLGLSDVGGKMFTVDDEIRAAMAITYQTAGDENNQVNGFVFIWDMTGFSAKHMTRWKMDDLKKWNSTWQKSMPGRFKAFHYYNTGSIFEALMAMTQPFMPKKYQERIFVHDTMESLYKVVDPELLPIEYLPDDYTGPNAGTISKIIAKTKRELTDPTYRNMLLERTSNKYGVDESKRPAFKAVNESFRKLAVD